MLKTIAPPDTLEASLRIAFLRYAGLTELMNPTVEIRAQKMKNSKCYSLWRMSNSRGTFAWDIKPEQALGTTCRHVREGRSLSQGQLEFERGLSSNRHQPTGAWAQRPFRNDTDSPGTRMKSLTFAAHGERCVHRHNRVAREQELKSSCLLLRRGRETK